MHCRRRPPANTLHDSCCDPALRRHQTMPKHAVRKVARTSVTVHGIECRFGPIPWPTRSINRESRMRSRKGQMFSTRKTTGLPLRIRAKVAPGKAAIFAAFRSRNVWVSTTHLPGSAICRGSLSIHAVDCRRASYTKKPGGYASSAKIP